MRNLISAKITNVILDITIDTIVICSIYIYIYITKVILDITIDAIVIFSIYIHIYIYIYFF